MNYTGWVYIYTFDSSKEVFNSVLVTVYTLYTYFLQCWLTDAVINDSNLFLVPFYPFKKFRDISAITGQLISQWSLLIKKEIICTTKPTTFSKISPSYTNTLYDYYDLKLCLWYYFACYTYYITPEKTNTKTLQNFSTFLTALTKKVYITQ